MVTCPRCQQPVDESVRTVCPLCFTPIPRSGAAGTSPVGASPEQHFPLTGAPVDYSQDQADAGTGYSPTDRQPTLTVPDSPQPPAPRPMNPGARLSLAGDVIEAGLPATSLPLYGGSGRPAEPAANPLSRPRPPLRPSREETAPPQIGKIITLAIALAVLLIAGFVAWYLWMHRTNPADQALAVYRAYLTQDYKSAYALSALSPEMLKKYPDADTFASAQHSIADGIISGNPNLAPLKSAIETAGKEAAASASVGNPAILGDKADVPTSSSINIMGQSAVYKGTAHMINDNGIWKLDLTAAGAQNQARAAMDLVGQLNLSGVKTP